MKCILLILFLSFSSFILAQDDGYISLPDRIKSNLFLVTESDRTTCNIGEPIIVTFKLYSALHSESAILKNPPFKGFDIQKLDSESEMPSRETVDGVPFDVHTLLKVQLTPSIVGKLIIGSMVVRNKVKLQHANGSKDPILDGITEPFTLSDGYYSINISSNAIPVYVSGSNLDNVATLSQSTEPRGLFQMNVQLSNKVLSPGEQATLSIMIGSPILQVVLSDSVTKKRLLFILSGKEI